MTDFIRFAKILTAFLIVIWLFFTFILGIRMAPNEDMQPSIQTGDMLVYYRSKAAIIERNVVAVRKNGRTYFLRVVARPGDTVDISENEVKVNGNTEWNEKANGDTRPYEGHTVFPLTLGQDEYFVLADKRDGGEDSRYFGAVHINEIKGIVIGVFRRNSI